MKGAGRGGKLFLKEPNQQVKSKLKPRPRPHRKGE